MISLKHLITISYEFKAENRLPQHSSLSHKSLFEFKLVNLNKIKHSVPIGYCME